MKVIPDLPASSDELFAEAEVIHVGPFSQHPPAVSHRLVWDGGQAVCTSCAFQHTFPISPSQWDIVDGAPVRKA